jgi:acyl-homoserine lactone acylase PvdQ
LGVVSNNGKLEQVGAPTNIFEDAPSSSNPFKGYVFTLKPKAGLFFPFKGSGYSGFKLSAFYDLGLSKYQFYTNDIFNTRLKNYTGETKSSYNAFGVQASLIIAVNK